MPKLTFSNTFNISPTEVKRLRTKNVNSVYSKTLNLEVGEAFVIFDKTLSDVNIPYGIAKQRNMKIVTKSNYRTGNRQGLLVTRIA